MKFTVAYRLYNKMGLSNKKLYDQIHGWLYVNLLMCGWVGTDSVYALLCEYVVECTSMEWSNGVYIHIYVGLLSVLLCSLYLNPLRSELLLANKHLSTFEHGRVWSSFPMVFYNQSFCCQINRCCVTVVSMFSARVSVRLECSCQPYMNRMFACQTQSL